MNERPGHQRLAAWLTCRSCESLSSRRDAPEEHCPSKAPCLAGATCTQAAWECSVPSPCPGAGKAAALSPSPADVLMSHRNFQRERAEDEDETIRSPEACQDLIANSCSYHRRHPLPGGDRVATSILYTSGAIAVTHSGPMVSFRYHCRLYNEWRRTNQRVILLIPKSVHLPSNQQSLLGLHSAKRNSKETIV